MHIGLGETLTAPRCAALPSGQAVFNLVSGDWTALPAVVGTAAARAVLVGTGMALAGEREHLVRNALGGALAIEAFVFAWALYKKG
ncbi:MAG: hypothetical protein WAN65_03790 [Candidatus Sulfotelmatobacter sp.]